MIPFSDKTIDEYAHLVNHQRLHWPTLESKGLTAYLRRDDLASQHYPGNKFYKLFYHLQALQASDCRVVISFGGAYSNHIHALAAMGQQYNMATVGIIRGHRPKILSPTLQDAQNMGMRLFFLNKQDYKNKDISTLLPLLNKEYGPHYLLPEGGESLQGILGCRHIGQAIEANFSSDFIVCCAVGTGTTMAGIIAGLEVNRQCIGFSVLKGEDQLSSGIDQWLAEMGCSNEQWQVITGYHHGGYAKTTPELLRFMKQIENDNQLLLEPVYSAKMFWGVEQLALQNFWPEGTQLVLVHGGGLQGRRGFKLN